MEYYEFQYLVKELLDHLKRENDANKGQQEQQSGMMGNMKMPNMKIPSMKIPKM
jgi:hypothetical protein|tara:strand:+ start:2254 stop:2415 length:162 start_codon:yes stop_codon:yes gene_type:complete